MKRLLIVLLVFSLLLPAAGMADAAPADPVSALMEAYQGLSGNVHFSLPGAPLRFVNQDMPGYITDWTELTGNCAADGGEYQFNTADIGGLLESQAAQHPDREEPQVRLNALMTFAGIFPFSFGAELGDVTPSYDRATGDALIEFTFTYPDTPGVQYYGKATLEGTRATSLVIEECEHSGAVLDSMRFLRAENAEAFRAERSTPVDMTLCGLTMTFPCAPTDLTAGSPRNGNGSELSCLSADYTLIDVQWWDYAPTLTGTDADRETAEALARTTALTSLGAEAMENAVLSRPAPDMLQFDFDTQSRHARPLGEYGPRTHVRIYAGPQGTCAILTDQTPAGEAFLASVRPAEETAASTGTDLVPAEDKSSATVTDVSPAADLPAPGTSLSGFLLRAGAACDEDRFSLGCGSDGLVLSTALFTDGEWLRTVTPAEDPALGFAFVSLDGPEPDAAIREIRVIGAFDEAPDMPKLARLCAWALCGGDEETLGSLGAGSAGQDLRLECGTAVFSSVRHPRSELFYDCVRIVPDDVPALRVNIREFDDGELMPVIGGDVISVRVFTDRVKSLLPVSGVFTSFDFYARNEYTESVSHSWLLGTTLVRIDTATASEDDPIQRIQIVNFSGDPQEALAAAMICCAALADGDPVTLTAIAEMLAETPMWDELCDRWPFVSDGRMLCFLAEIEVGGRSCPSAYIVGVPEE